MLRFLLGIFCLLAWSAPLTAQERMIEGAATNFASSIPSAHLSFAENQVSTVTDRAGSAGEFPSLAPVAEQAEANPQPGGFATPLVTVVSSLAIVLGLFAGLVCLTRKFGRGNIRAGSMPSDVLQTLGSTAIDGRTRVTMLRCGSRIIVAAQTASGIHPLCEITDPREVHELTVACTGASPASLAKTGQAAQTSTTSEPIQRRGRLFATA